MQVFIAGATGATGRHVARFLLDRGAKVRMVVRSADRLPAGVGDHPKAEITEASLLDMTDEELAGLVDGASAVVSCLGHNLTFKGLYGKPRRLVRDATRRMCKAIEAGSPADKVRFILMNSSGNRNRDLNEHVSLAHRAVIALLRVALPPHPDNEQAADHLRTEIGQSHPAIEWVAVRPDGLFDEGEVTPYTAVASPVRDSIFDAGKVSRINVAHFIYTLCTDDAVWKMWKGQMPVLYGDEYLE